MGTGRTLRVDDPYTGEVVCAIPLATPRDAAAALARAAEAQAELARLPVRERAALVVRFADALLAAREGAAREVTRATGKPVRESRREVEVTAARARALAGIAEAALADRPLPRLHGVDRFVSREPVGVVLLLAPWSDPLLTAASVLVPAVLAGNAVIVKPSLRAPLSGARLAGAFAEAGAPSGLVHALVSERDAVGELLARPEVGLVAFTGMPRAWLELQRQAGTRVRPGIVQLFGNDAAYVAEDADLDRAAQRIAAGAFTNAGQGSASVRRAFVAGPVEEAFVERLVAAAGAFVPDDPMDDATTLGPLAEPKLLAKAAELVLDARARGGLVLCGGERATVGRRGRFYPATVVAGATPGMTLMSERTRAPILGVMRVDSDDAALAALDGGDQGLTASVWTRSDARALELARRLRVGAVCQNDCSWAEADLPWAGAEECGLGPPFASAGFLELTRAKAFHLRRG